MHNIIKNADISAIRRSYPTQYPFSSMDVGDGFDVDNDLGHTGRGASRRLNSIRNSLQKYRKASGSKAKFLIGTHLDDPSKIRCVRVA